MNVRALFVGVAQTVLEKWTRKLAKIVQIEEPFCEVLTKNTGAGTYKVS